MQDIDRAYHHKTTVGLGHPDGLVVGQSAGRYYVRVAVPYHPYNTKIEGYTDTLLGPAEARTLANLLLNYADDSEDYAEWSEQCALATDAITAGG